MSFDSPADLSRLEFVEHRRIVLQERRCGIESFVSAFVDSNPVCPFSLLGSIKKCPVDFVVQEIGETGRVADFYATDALPELGATEIANVRTLEAYEESLVTTARDFVSVAACKESRSDIETIIGLEASDGLCGFIDECAALVVDANTVDFGSLGERTHLITSSAFADKETRRRVHRYLASFPEVLCEIESESSTLTLLFPAPKYVLLRVYLNDPSTRQIYELVHGRLLGRPISNCTIPVPHLTREQRSSLHALLKAEFPFLHPRTLVGGYGSGLPKKCFVIVCVFQRRWLQSN